MVGHDPAHPDEHRGAGGGIAVVLAQMHAKAAARHLGIERKIVPEAVFPVDPEAQEIDIEVHRLLDREDAQDGDRVPEVGRLVGHGTTVRRTEAARQRISAVLGSRKLRIEIDQLRIFINRLAHAALRALKALLRRKIYQRLQCETQCVRVLTFEESRPCGGRLRRR